MTIFATLDILKLNDWQHIVVRTKNHMVLGGGYPPAINLRFGNLDLLSVDIFNGILVIYVDDVDDVLSDKLG